MDIQDRIADIETKIEAANRYVVNAIHQLQEVKNELRRLEEQSEKYKKAHSEYQVL